MRHWPDRSVSFNYFSQLALAPCNRGVPLCIIILRFYWIFHIYSAALLSPFPIRGYNYSPLVWLNFPPPIFPTDICSLVGDYGTPFWFCFPEKILITKLNSMSCPLLWLMCACWARDPYRHRYQLFRDRGTRDWCEAVGRRKKPQQPPITKWVNLRRDGRDNLSNIA